MEKLGVVIDDEKVKTAELTGARRCPKCGTTLDPHISMNNSPCCPNCGTEPFEKRPIEDK